MQTATDTTPYTARKLVWHNILFFGTTTLIGTIGTAIYAAFVGLEAADWGLFLFMCAATMMSTTLGYHRFFAHRAFKAHPTVELACLFFGAAAFEQSAMTWSSQHRDHHRFTDTDRDPYDIKKGFWYAHMGWFLFNHHRVDYTNVHDLSSRPIIKNQHENWTIWAILGGFIFPLAVGLATGHFWGAFFLGVMTRFVVVHQSVFLINSACHMFGKATYDGSQTARDSWVCALFTNGEGYHNYHHVFPNDYRNGVRWYHWDPTKWTIRVLSWVGLAWDLRRTPEVQIIGARISQEQASLIHSVQAARHPMIAEVLQHVATHTDNMKTSLKHWEQVYIEYRRAREAGAALRRKEIKPKLRDARENFYAAYKQWLDFVNRNSLAAQTAS